MGKRNGHASQATLHRQPRNENGHCDGRASALRRTRVPRHQHAPHRGPRAKSLIGLHKGRIKIRGDIVSPIGTGLWEALR